MKLYRRLPRVDLPNATYFASVTTAGLRPWFSRPAPAQMLSQLICRERGRSLLLHAFVVMPDHYHILLTLLGEHRLPRVIQRVNSISARHVNASLDRRGAIWARRFFDHVVRNADDFRECFQYIHDNPRASAMVSLGADYSYSSVGYWERGVSRWGEFDPP